MSKLKFWSLAKLIKLRENNYFSAYLDKSFDPQLVDFVIHQKTKNLDKRNKVGGSPRKVNINTTSPYKPVEYFLIGERHKD